MASTEQRRGPANTDDVSVIIIMAGLVTYGVFTAVCTDESLVQNGEALKTMDMPMSGLWLLCVIGTRYANQMYRRLLQKCDVSR